MKTRILRTQDDLKRCADNILKLGQYLPLKIMIDQYKPTRSIEQNDKLHAMCRDISKQRQWAGKWLDAEDWKRLLVDLYTRSEESKPPNVVPSLDGAGVVSLGELTRNMNTTRMAGLIEFTIAWCAEEQITLSE